LDAENAEAAEKARIVLVVVLKEGSVLQLRHSERQFPKITVRKDQP
jgi:hypothetical protein